MNLEEFYQPALEFAAAKHKGQNMKSRDCPLLVHVVGVATEVLVASFYTPEFNTPYAVQMALLHDTVENSNTSLKEIERKFDKEVAAAVSALTKAEDLPKQVQLQNSLERIKNLPKEVWAVKLADRINSLQKPPRSWSLQRVIQYFQDACLIRDMLKGGNKYLEKRLNNRITDYRKYL